MTASAGRGAPTRSRHRQLAARRASFEAREDEVESDAERTDLAVRSTLHVLVAKTRRTDVSRTERALARLASIQSPPGRAVGIDGRHQAGCIHDVATGDDRRTNIISSYANPYIRAEPYDVRVQSIDPRAAAEASLNDARISSGDRPDLPHSSSRSSATGSSAERSRPATCSRPSRRSARNSASVGRWCARG